MKNCQSTLLRKISLILGVAIVLEIMAILMTPTCEKELAVAKQEYETAKMENARLNELIKASIDFE